MSEGVVDLLVVGGGINGAGIARDAVGRGLAVTLVEQDDLASGTSSWSTKLIHGGLRYLEYYEFRLVREALIEREVLWAIAPHIIRPLRFVLPHHRGLRPAWMLRLGLFLYDHLGGRKRLPATKTLDLTTDATGGPLKSGYAKGFEYSDCAVDDARLVVLNARDAADRGATILTRTRAVAARREGGLWHVTVENLLSGERRDIAARALVNAAGPWVERFLTEAVRTNAPAKVRLVQGSHIVVPKLYDHDRAYIFQNADNRIIFAIPYEGAFTLIGTTDQDYHGDPKDVAATTEEIEYLCSAASEYFTREIKPVDVVWTYSGVRPLYDDGASAAQEATRDYVLNRDGQAGEAPMISVFGGKITTYRRLAMSALELLEADLPQLKQRPGWTAGAALPGGDFPIDGAGELAASLRRSHPALDPALLDRLAHAYGTRARTLLDGVKSPQDMGRAFAAGLTEREIAYLVANEWAVTADDVLWRRSKLGLHMTPSEREAVKAHMGA
jgi:glycerol-3-phosphate dehydrogenase